MRLRLPAILRVGTLAPVRLRPIAGEPEGDAVIDQLDASIRWYDRRARIAMQRHILFRGMQIAVGAALPLSQIVMVGFAARVAAGLLGAIVVVVLGLDGLLHDSEHAILDRATAQNLMRERFLYSVRAGVYTSPPPPQTAKQLLAANIEAVTSTEVQQWTTIEETGSQS